MDRLWRQLDAEGAVSRLRHEDFVTPLLACALSFGLCMLLSREFAVHLPFMAATAAVLISTVAGGMLPGLLATGLGTVFVFLVARHAYASSLLVANTVVMVGFQLACVGIGESLRRSRLNALQQTARLRAREAHLESIFDALPAAMLVVDRQGIIGAASAEAGRLFGYALQDLQGMSLQSLFPGADSSMLDRLWHLSAEVTDEAIEARRRDGQAITLHLAATSAELDVGRVLTLYVQDATEKVTQGRRLAELQEELVRTARLTALGEMGAAIAHELNQPLSAAVNYLAVAQRQAAAAPEPLRRDLTQIIDEASQEVLRAGTVLKRLRGFVSRRPPDHQDVDMREIVGETAFLARLMLKEARTELSLEPGSRPAWVCADRVQIQQVILNLIRNSAEAMKGAAERRIDVSVHEDEDGVVVCVRDTGPGIPPQIQTRLFERFNTSKPDGMGVGLAICRSIIEAHGGQIWSQAPEDGGAAFYFRLPAVLSAEQANAA